MRRASRLLWNKYPRRGADRKTSHRSNPSEGTGGHSVMATPVDYYERYLNVSVPDPNNGSDLAANISVSKYLLGLKDEQTNARVALLKKIQKDLAAGKKADSNYKIRIAAHTSAAREVAEFSTITTQENDPLWMLIRYPYAGKGSPEGIQ